MLSKYLSRIKFICAIYFSILNFHIITCNDESSETLDNNLNNIKTRKNNNMSRNSTHRRFLGDIKFNVTYNTRQILQKSYGNDAVDEMLTRKYNLKICDDLSDLKSRKYNRNSIPFNIIRKPVCNKTPCNTREENQRKFILPNIPNLGNAELKSSSKIKFFPPFSRINSNGKAITIHNDIDLNEKLLINSPAHVIPDDLVIISDLHIPKLKNSDIKLSNKNDSNLSNSNTNIKNSNKFTRLKKSFTKITNMFS